MNIEYFETPIPYIIVRNYFSEEELDLIWQEFDFLTYQDKLADPYQTNAAKDQFGNVKKQNRGLFLDEIYTNRSYSNILKITRKLWNPDFLKEIESKNFIFRYLRNSNMDSTLLSYYEDSDYYLPHHDTAVITAVTNFYKEPKAFTGGDLFIENESFKIPLENNRLILFPSIALHSVTPVVFDPETPRFKGLGRYTLSQFAAIGIRP